MNEMWDTLEELAVTEGEGAGAEFWPVNYHFGDRRSPTNRVPFHYIKGPGEIPTGSEWTESNEFERASGEVVPERGWRATAFRFAPVCWGRYPTQKIVDEAGEAVWVPVELAEGEWPAGTVFYSQFLGISPSWSLPLLVRGRAYRSVAWWTLLEQFQKTYLQKAQEAALRAGVRTGVPSWAYWMPIDVERDAKGLAVYRPIPKRPGQFYTQPVLRLPPGGADAIDEAALAALFTGRDTIERGRMLWRKYREMVKHPPAAAAGE